jgi:hypothetical protein
MQKCVWREVPAIHTCLGPFYVQCAYPMTNASFWRLYKRITPGIEAAREACYGYEKKGGRAGSNYVDPLVPNGPTLGSDHLGCALHYFTGGSPYSIMVKYGFCYQDMLASVWIVIHTINTIPAFQINYPSPAVEQDKIAQGFKSASTVGFDNCAGAIDGVLIWMLKPTAKAGVGQKKTFCGRKNKFGLNCQAVSTVHCKILDISITYGGSSSDLLAYNASDL